MATASPSRTAARPRKPACRIYIVRKKTIREIHVRPWLVLTLAAFGMAFFVAYFAATGYLFFRDDLLAASYAREARQKQAYEDRIASLRVDIDRLASRQLLDQEAFEARLQTVASRQAALDERQEILAGLSKAARNAGLVTAPKESGDGAESDDAITTGSIAPGESGPDQMLAGVETSLDDLGVQQVAFLEEVAAKAAERSDRIVAVLKEIGRSPPKARGGSAMGGPFVPMPSNADPETFRDGVELVKAEVVRFEKLQETASGLPLSTPMSKGSITSRFGMRTDPFRRRPAMHTGIDFRAPTGQPARATAGGKVISAGYNRGYGNMVEIDHGNGLTTRFAHLSKILVKKGQTVGKGDTVGQTGSTGRSTGPHLHYEVRVNGRAVDPMTFIRAGDQILPLL